MCGIAGYLDTRTPLTEADFARLCTRMVDTLVHRGPDAGGTWVDAERGIALGHRRLSIIDLSSSGAQPMTSSSGRFVISFNGEVYNFVRLRGDLEKHGQTFRGHSDTEVMLAAFEHWGVERALERFEGMFAFALWDRQSARLTLARDRVGKKPLYYGWCGHTFLFGSELKALVIHPRFDASIDMDAVGQYMQYGWIANPGSVYRHIRQLPPASYLQLAADSNPWSVAPRPFWSAASLAEAGERYPFTGSYDQALERLEELLRTAVAERMVADVELGALLSGGIDSSMIVALMQSLSDRPVKTFSIGFSEPERNEAHHAASVAVYLGTDHQELYVTPEQALAVVEQLPAMYDEPFSDPSQIPTYLVCKLASRDVKVALSGDGGDETFAGYRRYRTCLDRWQRLQGLPLGIRTRIGRLQTVIGNTGWRVLAPRDPFSVTGVKTWRRKLGKAGQYACNWHARYPQQVLANDLNHCFAIDDLVPAARTPLTPLTDSSTWAGVDDPARAMLHFDYLGYLPDDILVKVDRASMAVSLEARSPLLDPRILAFAWSLPMEFLVSPDGSGKRILRDLLFRHVPRELVDRPKRGFGVPLDSWFRGPLREWAEDLISERTLAEQGIFDVELVRRLWAQHLCKWRNHSMVLWSILMFQAWWKSSEIDISAGRKQRDVADKHRPPIEWNPDAGNI
jgi:asparagine synthase (glutamine-hydrolysing)